MKALILLPVALLALAGCSKESEGSEGTPQTEVVSEGAPAEAAPAEAAPAVETAAAPAAAAPPAEVVSDEAVLRDLQAVPSTLQSGNYDSAVDTLGALSLAPLTDAQRQAYAEQMWRAQEYLRQKAETDEKAREAYQRLGKAKMGR